MAKSYTDLIEIIAKKIEVLAYNGEHIFDYVYRVANAQPEGYPCAFVVDNSGDGDTLDTARNQREWIFKLTLMQEKSRAGKTPEEAQMIMRRITDSVLQMFDQDPQLAVLGVDSCIQARVVSMRFDYVIREQPFVFAEFDINCVDVVNRYN